MNAQRYRLVFNEIRGILMAVAETATSRGKGDAPARTKRPVVATRRFDLRPTALACSLLLGGTFGFLPYAEAQIVADRNAPVGQQPIVLNAGNGVPVVNIQPPSAAGVSRNTYSQFDVQANGAILNNARNNTQSQQGGWIQGNPYLAAGTARVILNEVNSANPSLLRGYLEVAGDRAQVVVANPAGVTCDGCGFINAHRITLTTGTPLLNGGNLDGYLVRGGQIDIQGKGLDASGVDYTDLIARAVVVNAGLWANQLKVVTGANQVSAAADSAIPVSGSGPAPAFAIDVAQLGGMYAGKIHLVGTETGVGVRNAGQIGASIGEVRVTVDGLLTNSGRIAGSTQLSIDAQTGIVNSGTLHAQGDTDLATRGSLDNTGIIAARNNTLIQATGPASRIDSRSGSLLAAGLDADGTLVGSGELTIITSDQVMLKGQTMAVGNLRVAGSALDLTGGALAGNHINLTARTGAIDATAATVQAAATLIAATTRSLRTDAARVSAEQLTLAAHDLSNIGGEILQTGSADTAISLPGQLDNTHGRIAANSHNLTLAADTLSNTDGTIEHAGSGTLSLRAATLSGQRGQITGNAALAIDAGRIDHREARSAASQITINAASLDNRQGQILHTGNAQGTLTLSGAFDNRGGTLAGNGNTAITTATLDNRGGTLQAANNARLDLTTQGLLDNSARGKIAADGPLALGAGTLDNTQGQITAGTTLSINVQNALTNNQGLIAAQGPARLAAATLDNTRGTIASVQDKLTLTTTGQTRNDSGKLQAGGDLELSAAGLSNTLAAGQSLAGLIVGNTLTIDTHGQTLNNTLGTIAASQDATLRSGALANDGGLIQTGGNLAMDTAGQALGNANGIILSQRQATLTVGNIDNQGGLLTGKEGLTVSAQTIGNTQTGIVSSEGALSVSATALDNQGGKVLANGNLTLSLAAGTLDNTGGLVHSGGQLTARAGQLTNARTTATTQGLEGQNVDIAATALDNTQGNIRANDNLNLNIGQTLDNTGGHISSLRDITVTEAPGTAGTLRLSNTGGEFLAGRNLNLTIARLLGSGKLYALNDLTLTGWGNLDLSGELIANHDAQVTAAGTLSNSGILKAGNQLRLTAADLNNSATGDIAAITTTVNVTGTLTNRGLIDGQEVRIDAATLNNLGPARLYGDHLAIAAGTLNNQAESGLAPVIAARTRLDLGVNTLNNLDNALIYSVYDLSLGRSLDAQGQATGQAATLTNSSATIEAGRDISFSVASILNQRTTFAYTTSSGSSYADYSVLDFRPAGPWGLFKAALVTPSSTTVTEDSGAARILAGRNLAFDGSITNDKSDIMAGGNIVLDQARYVGTSLQGQNSQAESGITIYCTVCANSQPSSNGLQKIRSVVTLALLQKWAATGYDNNDLTYTPQIGTDQDTGDPIYGSPTSLLDYPLAHAFAPATVTPYSSSNIVQNTVNLASARLTANQAIVGTATQITNLSIGGGVGQNATGTQAGSVAATGNRNLSPIVQVAALSGIAASGPNTVIRSGGLNLTLPNNSLFLTHPEPGSRVLIETDPRFANYRTWLSSDYLLQALAIDPATTQKRLGDGFYEQKLVREQIAELTGRRFLDGYASDEAQYRALMEAGLTVASAWNLRPGVALTPAQMAQLTSDIVWLVEQTITLPDAPQEAPSGGGSTQKALVPQVYVRVRAGDLANDGALIAADRIDLNVTGDLLNQGRIAGRQVVALTADNIKNLGGRITGDAIALAARTDLLNIGGDIAADRLLSVEAGRDIQLASTLQSKYETSALFQQTTTTLDRLAGLYVTHPGGTLSVAAGRDLTLTGARIDSAGTARVAAGRDIVVGTLAEQTQRTLDLPSDNLEHHARTTQAASRIETGSDQALRAGQDLTVTGSALHSEGKLSAQAGHALTLATARLQESSDYRVQTAERDAQGKAGSDRSQISTVTATGNVSLNAGTTLASEGARIKAGGDVALAGQTIALMSAHDYSQSSGQITDTGKGAQQGQYQTERDTATGSIVSAGRDLKLSSTGNTVVEGGALAAGRRLDLATGGDLALLAARSTNSEERFEYKQRGKQATTLSFSQQEVRQLLTTITVGEGANLAVGGSFTADTGERRADGSLNADRMTVDGVVKGDSRQQVSVSRSGEGADANPENSQVVGNLKAQGIRNHSNDSFEPTAANATQTGSAALQQYLQSGLLQVKSDPRLASTLQAQLQADGSTLTVKDDSGRLNLTVAGEARVQAVYNTLKLSETFDVKKFPDAQTAQIVTLVVAVALTVCTGGAAGAVGVAMVGSAGTTALVINAAVIALSSTMIGQLAGGASFDQAFQAGIKAAATSAVLAGVSAGIAEAVNGTAAGTPTTLDSGGQTIQAGTNAGSNVAGTAAGASSKLDALTTAKYWQQTALNAAAKGLVAQAQGGKFKDGALASTLGSLGATGAGIIGDQFSGTDFSSTVSNMAAHAVLGCAAAAASKQDCGAGALGGAASAGLARIIDASLKDAELSKETREAVIAGGAVAGSALLANAVGKDALTAGNAAANEVLNNYLSHAENEARLKAARACVAGDAQACNQRDAWDAIDKERDTKLREACFANGASPECSARYAHMSDALNSYKGKATDPLTAKDRAAGLDKYTAASERESFKPVLNVPHYDAQAIAKATEAIKLAGNLALDMTPGIGDVKAFAEANTKLEYALAVVGALGPAGDLTKALVKEAKLALEAGDAVKAAEKITEANRGLINESNRLVKQYVDDIEKQTGIRLGETQRAALANEMRTGNHAATLTPSENAVLRAEFNSQRTKLITEWEQQTGQKWPQVQVVVRGELRSQNAPAHHVIPVQNNGPTAWWNITPAPQQGHSAIHAPDGPLNKIQSGVK